jgi:hypothetical protein
MPMAKEDAVSMSKTRIWIVILVTVACTPVSPGEVERVRYREGAIPDASTIEDSRPNETGSVTVTDIGTYRFEPHQVTSKRPDIFNPGYFSLFDVLAHLDERGALRLRYHFDETLDTHIIDGINDTGPWWYDVYYDGGWSEASVHRADTYPVKDKMTIRFVRDSADNQTQREAIWRTEVARRQANGGRVIVPHVFVRAFGESLSFENVEVTAYNTRGDFFRSGVITALDAIRSMGDSGLIFYEVAWYEKIGGAEVGNYYVERINDWLASGMCGFVYEVGELATQRGNHIHLQTDLRVLQSPEYLEIFWIELGPC